MEHHSNIVPWMLLSEELGGLDIRYIPVDGLGRLDLSDLDRLVSGVKVVAVSAMSNVLGTINPVAAIAEVAHREGAVVVADGAQLVPHVPSTWSLWTPTSSAFSAHKTMGPTGLGRAVGPGRAARGHAAVPRRRRDDPRRQARRLPGRRRRRRASRRGRRPSPRRSG